MLTSLCFLLVTLSIVSVSFAHDYHVSVDGNDANNGSASQPFKTISAAATVAQPGDVITVHGGTYREYVNPPRGGTSDSERITYQAAEGETVVVKGSEEVTTDWEVVHGDTWKTTIPNSFFGDFNPYSNLINGDWFIPKGREHHTGAVYLNEHWLVEAEKLDDVMEPTDGEALWFAQVDEQNTTIWAQFKGVDPNESNVEINVRQTIFYPRQTGTNYITLRGFIMKHAATPWAPPTAEQIGLVGTNWSKGWIIENNDISYSTCTGITLGKYGDEWDNTSENSAEGYVKTIERALKNGWSKDNVGSHIVRNNTVSRCEQAGIVGSLGAVFSEITGNTVHHIHVRRKFNGHEMAGIKIHAAIDTLIKGNHVHHCYMGLWLDWMTQGTRVSSNVFHDNPVKDLYIEVNLGPFVVDNNISLSEHSLVDWSQGGSYAHNLFAGSLTWGNREARLVPYHEPHSTNVAGYKGISGGDNRFYNNIFLGGNGIESYQTAKLPVFAGGNLYLNGSKPLPNETGSVVLSDYDPKMSFTASDSSVQLHLTLPEALSDVKTQFVTTELLGKASVPQLPYMNYDGTALKVDSDYFGNKRNGQTPAAGPFETPQSGGVSLKVK